MIVVAAVYFFFFYSDLSSAIASQVERESQLKNDATAADAAFERDAVWPPGGFWERRETARVVATLPYLDGAALGLELDAERARHRHVAGETGELRAHTGDTPVAASGSGASSLMLRSSSTSMDAMSRSSISGTPIWWTTSAKKPRTTIRRAWSAGIPRACR